MSKPLKPTNRSLPAGFEDAIGLDDAAIPMKPIFVKSREVPTEKRKASENASSNVVAQSRRH